VSSALRLAGVIRFALARHDNPGLRTAHRRRPPLGEYGLKSERSYSVGSRDVEHDQPGPLHMHFA
jgi:hypothetical protein